MPLSARTPGGPSVYARYTYNDLLPGVGGTGLGVYLLRRLLRVRIGIDYFESLSAMLTFECI